MRWRYERNSKPTTLPPPPESVVPSPIAPVAAGAPLMPPAAPAMRLRQRSAAAAYSSCIDVSGVPPVPVPSTPAAGAVGSGFRTIPAPGAGSGVIGLAGMLRAPSVTPAGFRGPGSGLGPALRQLGWAGVGGSVVTAGLGS